jgi:hypothetical protein
VDDSTADGRAAPDPAMRDFILAQGAEVGGAAVVLFTTATLHPGPRAGESAPALVTSTARELGLPAEIALFGFPAYRLQCALGAELLPAER